MKRPWTWIAAGVLAAAGAALLPAWLAPENVADWTRLATFCR
jgi:hypothetical protein